MRTFGHLFNDWWTNLWTFFFKPISQLLTGPLSIKMIFFFAIFRITKYQSLKKYLFNIWIYPLVRELHSVEMFRCHIVSVTLKGLILGFFDGEASNILSGCFFGGGQGYLFLETYIENSNNFFVKKSQSIWVLVANSPPLWKIPILPY